MHRSLYSIWLVAMLLGPAAFADVQLNESRIWRRAQVLPSGQQVWDFESSYQNMSNRYSAEGVAQPLGTALSRAVTWHDLMKSNPKAQKDLRSFISAHALSESSPVARSTYDVEVREVAFGVNWAYGLTNTWMIGLRIPVVLRNTSVQERFQMNPILSQGTEAQNIQSLFNRKLDARVRQLSQAQLTGAGYDQIPEQKQSFNLSDISLMSQVAILDTFRWQWALQQVVRLPTAQTPNTADYVQISHDEGPVDLGVSSVLDYRRRGWIFGVRAGYVAQLPDQTRVRVPGDDNGGKGQVDPRVDRRLGDYAWGALDSEYRLTPELTLDAEYSYLSKNKDRYNSGTLSGVDYSSLAQGTDEQLHQARFGFFYRLGAESTHAGINAKWVVSADYELPLIGRNSGDAARTSLELINYF